MFVIVEAWWTEICITASAVVRHGLHQPYC